MNYNKIPEVLKEKALWCVWKYSEEKGKIPYNPKTNSRAKSNDPNTFADFEVSHSAFISGKYYGFGDRYF